MSNVTRSLHEDVFVLFERACREKDFELADLLLTALEGIARRREDDEQLVLAYLMFATACRSVENAGVKRRQPELSGVHFTPVARKRHASAWR